VSPPILRRSDVAADISPQLQGAIGDLSHERRIANALLENKLVLTYRLLVVNGKVGI
jgi:hypothetical protein